MNQWHGSSLAATTSSSSATVVRQFREPFLRITDVDQVMKIANIKHLVELFREIHFVYGPPQDGVLCAECEVAYSDRFTEGEIPREIPFLLKITPLSVFHTEETADTMLRQDRTQNGALRELAFLELLRRSSQTAREKGFQLALVNTCHMLSWTRIDCNDLRSALLSKAGTRTLVQGGLRQPASDHQSMIDIYDDDDDDNYGFSQSSSSTPPKDTASSSSSSSPSREPIHGPSVNHTTIRELAVDTQCLFGSGYGAVTNSYTVYQFALQQNCSGGTLEDYLLARASYPKSALHRELAVVYAQLFLQLHTLRTLFPGFSHGSLSTKSLMFSEADGYNVLCYDVPNYTAAPPASAVPLRLYVPLTEDTLCLKIAHFRTVTCRYLVTGQTPSDRHVLLDLPGTNDFGPFVDDCLACSSLCTGLFKFNVEREIPEFGRLMQALRRCDSSDVLIFAKLLQVEPFFDALRRLQSAKDAKNWLLNYEEISKDAELKISEPLLVGFASEAASPVQTINSAI
jgi:hypothetical protein